MRWDNEGVWGMYKDEELLLSCFGTDDKGGVHERKIPMSATITSNGVLV